MSPQVSMSLLSIQANLTNDVLPLCVYFYIFKILLHSLKCPQHKCLNLSPFFSCPSDMNFCLILSSKQTSYLLWIDETVKVIRRQEHTKGRYKWCKYHTAYLVFTNITSPFSIYFYKTEYISFYLFFSKWNLFSCLWFLACLVTMDI